MSENSGKTPFGSGQFHGEVRDGGSGRRASAGRGDARPASSDRGFAAGVLRGLRSPAGDSTSRISPTEAKVARHVAEATNGRDAKHKDAKREDANADHANGKHTKHDRKKGHDMTCDCKHEKNKDSKANNNKAKDEKGKDAAKKTAVAALAPVVANAALGPAGKAVRSTARKAVVGSLFGIAKIGLSLAAIIDIARKRPEQINGPKAFWYPVQALGWVGPLVYFLGGRKIGS